MLLRQFYKILVVWYISDSFASRTNNESANVVPSVEDKGQGAGITAINDQKIKSTAELSSGDREPKSERYGPTDEDQNDRYKIICYFTNWGWFHSPTRGVYYPELIKKELCTHMVYGFAKIDKDTLTLKPLFPELDVKDKMYHRITKHRNKGLKVLIGIGGWDYSGNDKYSQLITNPVARQIFIRDLILFMEEYNFEGVDLNWKFPACYQDDCFHAEADKKNFVIFIEELKSVLKLEGYLLTSVVTPVIKDLERFYDLTSLTKNFDWISFNTWDAVNLENPDFTYLAPLYYHPNITDSTYNANFSINYLLSKGVPPEKLVLGVPFFGHSFNVTNIYKAHPLYRPAQFNAPEEFKPSQSIIKYPEICRELSNPAWNVVKDPSRRVGPSLISPTQWITFDDAEQIKVKAKMIKALGLGGAAAWTLTFDDVFGICECGQFPLLRTINHVFKNYPVDRICSVKEIMKNVLTGPKKGAKESTSHLNHQSVPSSQSEPAIVCSNEEYKPHEKDRAKYFICKSGKFMEMTCAQGLYWNDNRCVIEEHDKDAEDGDNKKI